MSGGSNHAFKSLIVVSCDFLSLSYSVSLIYLLILDQCICLHGRISLLGGPGLKYVRGPLHYDKQTVGHKNIA